MWVFPTAAQTARSLPSPLPFTIVTFLAFTPILFSMSKANTVNTVNMFTLLEELNDSLGEGVALIA